MNGFGIWAGGAGALVLTFALTLVLFAAGTDDSIVQAQYHVVAMQPDHMTGIC